MSGILSAPEGAVEDVADTGDDAAGEGEQQQDTVAVPDQRPPEKVALTAPEKPQSRRERAAAESARKAVEGELAPLRDTLKSLQEERARERQESAERERRLFEMLNARQVPQQQEGPKQKSAADLMAEADKALTDGNVRDYQRLLIEAGGARAREEIEAFKRSMPQQQQQQPQMPPQLQAVFMSTPGGPQVLAHERGMKTAILKDSELALDGMEDGPARWAKAIQLAHNKLYPPEGGNAFPASGKSTLAGVPAAGRGGSSGAAKTPHVRLPPGAYERWGATSGFTKEEYARAYAEGNPNAVTED